LSDSNNSQPVNETAPTKANDSAAGAATPHRPPHHPESHPPIRSFILRDQRLTPGQQRAKDVLWPQFGLEYSAERLDLNAVFGRSAPLMVEIGFGNGASLAQMADDQPENNFLGIEVHTPGVGHCLLQIEQRGLTNLRLMQHDAVEVFQHSLAEHSIDRLQLYFPDPWHKKRHHKRRIVQKPFIELAASRLKPGGIWHMATDWEHYADQMLLEMDAAADFKNTAEAGSYSSKPEWRPQTKFETRGEKLGHGVWDLLYQRK